MRTKVIKSLKRRMEEEISSKNPLSFLKQHDIEEYVDAAISVVYLYTRPKRGTKNTSIFMTEVICAIGHCIRNKLKQKTNSSVAAKTGAFFLYTFEALGLLYIELGKGSNGHATFIVHVIDDTAICTLYSKLSYKRAEKLPSLTPYEPWTSTKHTCGVRMIKTGNKEVLAAVTPETHPIVYSCLNKAQTVGWRINAEIYDLYLWALRNKTDAFADIWELHSPEAKATKLREARAIGSMAKRFIGKIFYHLYSYDFRGRKYTNTAYLHEQGSDLARGMLLRADKKAIGKGGYFWLMVSLASNWAGDSGSRYRGKTDKIPLGERFKWSEANEDFLLDYAENPKKHQGWMAADKPWQFLAACKELAKLRIWQSINSDYNDFSYESHLEVYVDGSTNGSQHLAALTRDEITAPYVNLVPTELPGDLYMYVAEHVWNRITKAVDEVGLANKIRADNYIDALIELKKNIVKAEVRSLERTAAIEAILKFKLENEETGKYSAAVFWSRITSNKEKRKIVKRNCMTLPYGGTPYGLGQQQLDDAKKHGIGLLMYMEHRWGSYLGREVYEDCRVSLKRPMQLLEVFEAAGRNAEARGEFLSWTAPITNFPVVQNYTEGIVKKVWVQYGPPKGERLNTKYFINTLQLNICFIEDTKPSRGKQAQGASPNCIHTLDAAHLAMTVDQAEYPISTIHDSYGCLLADMPSLYLLVRDTFCQLYLTNPLEKLMEEIKGDLRNVELGTLDITLVKDSEYCFS